MNRLYKLTTLMFLMLFSFSLQAQTADDVVAPVEIRLNNCLIRDDLHTDFDVLSYVNLIMKPVYYPSDDLNSHRIFWRIELYDALMGKLKLEYEYDRPAAVVKEKDTVLLAACDESSYFQFVFDLNKPKVIYIQVFGIGNEVKKQFIVAGADDAKWIDYFINWAYYTVYAMDVSNEKLIKKHNVTNPRFRDAWRNGETRKKMIQIQQYLIDNYPKGYSGLRDKTIPTLEQLDKRMKTNFGVSNYFDSVTDEELSGKASTTNKPTTNTVATNLSKGEWRTSMRKVVDNVTEKYSDDVYKGQKSNGKRNGMGVYRWNSGSYYFGEWSNGDMNGYGLRVCGEGRAISNCPDCVYFVGNWKDDKKSGKGTCYDKYGNLIYYGDFADDRPTGTYPTTGNYSSYKFECINYESNNSVYIGETKDGKRHGYGVYIWNNWYGNAWYGHWENDKRSGNGIDLFYDGSIKYGRWDGDEYYSILSQATTSSADGNSWEVSGSSRSYTDIATPLTYIKNQIDDRGKCRLGAITEYGKGIVIHGNNGYAYTSIPNSLIEKIKEIGENKNRISSITLTNSGYYCIVYQRNAWYGVVPQKMSEKLHEFNNNQEEIRSVSISENGDFAIVTDKHYYASNDSDFNSMNKAHDKYGSIKNVCVTNKGICVVCQRGIYYYNIPSNLETKLKRLEYRPDHVTFTDSGTYLITTETQRYSYWM